MLFAYTCLILTLLLAIPSGGALFASPPPAMDGGAAVLKAAGTGMPRSGRTDAQARLLAKRAATVKAYRNLLRRLQGSSASLKDGRGTASTDGFIKGAYVDEIRYYQDGKVEVVVGINVQTKGGMEAKDRGAGEAAPGETYFSERPGTVITEKEWKSLQAEIE